ncbi:hypothetical protein PAECIP111891_05304 [Paenibacillus allorhizoplanae]|uniref:Uncharacterized protein n=1 Tax=Paenibacillus allorhizoplanae TaxID=2905648 RepID=A0ABN8H616_9BACL|nr:hypothetical protein [Paenibacillus allorhizoplanae]CAH1222201.1 hypothetical protein PAECIP111891_05304 [Paenibacillus allorhizoplanae]
MAICLEFELVMIRGTVAEYTFGSCLKEKDRVFEVDIPKLISGETSMDTPMDEVVKLKNDKQSQSMANRVFGKIYKHYLEHHEYVSKGGYYA